MSGLILVLFWFIEDIGSKENPARGSWYKMIDTYIVQTTKYEVGEETN